MGLVWVLDGVLVMVCSVEEKLYICCFVVLFMMLML